MFGDVCLELSLEYCEADVIGLNSLLSLTPVFVCSLKARPVESTNDCIIVSIMV